MPAGGRGAAPAARLPARLAARVRRVVRLRTLAAAAAIVLAVTALVGAWGLPLLEGLSLDVSFWLREEARRALALAPRDPATSPTVVIAIDEESYREENRRDLFGVRPKEAWTPELAQVLNAVREAGAAVIGFDIVLAASVREIASNYDREYLQALARASRENRVVLGRMQHVSAPIQPTREQNFIVNPVASNRALNLDLDPDNVTRRHPLSFDILAAAGQGSRREPSMALELAQRAAAQAGEWLPDGRLRFAGRIVPGSQTNTLLLNFEAGSDDIPTYSFQDLVRCTRAGNADFFRQHFAGRVVMIATVLDVEDRRPTSKRLITGPEGDRVRARCDPAAAPPAHFFDLDHGDGTYEPLTRRDIPGVYIHATAVNNLLRGDALAELGAGGQVGLLLAAAAGSVTVTLSWPLLAALGALAAATLAWTAATAALLQAGIVVPLFAPPLAAALALAGGLAWRFLVSDRDKRFLRRSFALYLAPAVVDRMVDSDRPPELGGEERQASFFFSDLAGFTTISESLTANELVVLMNTYLTAMTDIIEAHGGFVDKYIGDAIAAVFGAPLDEPDHALDAVKAALACEARLRELNGTEPAFRGHRIAQRIGINTGPALVGNIGSRRRFNYTAMGDAVNVAARLEGVNKVYGTRILVAESTVVAIGGRILFREVDRVRVVGRGHPLAIFEPLALAPGDAAQQARAAAQAAALAAWRRADFAAAAAAFAAMSGDPVAERFAARARAFVATPPPPGWEPVTNLETK